MRNLYYILDGHRPVPVADVREAERILSGNERSVARTAVGEHKVSTVFLVIDHNFMGEGDPVLFETMVFSEENKEIDGFTRRYSTWEQAEQGHKELVKMVQKYLAFVA